MRHYLHLIMRHQIHKKQTRAVAEAYYHLNRHALKWLAVKRAVFGKVKWVLFYTTIEEF